VEKFVLHPGESLLINDPHAVWMKTDREKIPGSIKLTNKRFVFEKKATPFLGMFVQSMKKQILFDYPLEKIKNYSSETNFKSVNIIIDNGIERPKKFETSKIDNLEAELKNLNIQGKE
jgi:hypothetical protein